MAAESPKKQSQFKPNQSQFQTRSEAEIPTGELLGILKPGTNFKRAQIRGIAAYTASRGAVLSMTKSLAAEWGKYGITVNVLAPGWFKTAQNAVLYENKEWVNYITDRIPLNRPGQPHDLDVLQVKITVKIFRSTLELTLKQPKPLQHIN